MVAGRDQRAVRPRHHPGQAAADPAAARHGRRWRARWPRRLTVTVRATAIEGGGWTWAAGMSWSVDWCRRCRGTSPPRSDSRSRSLISWTCQSSDGARARRAAVALY